jgi:hypothetical protein
VQLPRPACARQLTFKNYFVAFTPAVVGERHYYLVGRVQAIMEKYESLKNIIAIVGENELSPADRADYQSAKKLIDFFSQDFNVAEHLTGKPGQYFTREQTLDGIEAIVGKEKSWQTYNLITLRLPAPQHRSNKTQSRKDRHRYPPLRRQAKHRLNNYVKATNHPIKR